MTALQPKLSNAQLVFENQAAVVYDSPEHQLVYAIWKQAIEPDAWLHATQFVADYISDAEYVAYIADGQGAVPMSHDAIKAVMEVVIPLYREAGLKCMAMIIPEELSVEMTMQTLINELPIDFEATHAFSLEDALDWVKHKREF